MSKKTIFLIIIVVAALVLVKIFFLSPDKDKGAKQQAKGAPAASPVTAYVVEPRLLQNKLYASGNLMANEEVSLLPEVAGKIVELHFEEGGAVKQGQLLVKINDADLQAQLKKQIALNKQALDVEERMKQVLQIKGVSQEEYDAARTQVSSTQADIELTRAQIEKTEIRSPFNGVIGLKNVSLGSYVTPTTLIAMIQQIDPVKLDFAIPEKYASRVKRMDTVIFSFDGREEQTFKGYIYAIEPKINASTRTLQLRALCPNKKGELYPGAFARVQLVLSSLDALQIPTEAVIPDIQGKKVFVAKNGKAASVRIQTGDRSERFVEVMSGLHPGDTVITTGIMQLKADAPVKIINLKNTK